MNSFRLYDYLTTDMLTRLVPEQSARHLVSGETFGDDALLALVSKAEKSVVIYSREGRQWNRLASEFWKLVAEKRTANPNFAVSITLGRWMIAADTAQFTNPHGADTPLNALTQGFFDYFGYRRHKNSHIFFNDVGVWDQMELGYFNSVIVDEKSVIIEKPHGCPQAGAVPQTDDYDWVIVEDSPKYAKEVLQSQEAYVRLAGLSEDSSLKKTAADMRQFTASEAEYYKLESVLDCNFSTREQYKSLMHEKIGVVYG